MTVRAAEAARWQDAEAFRHAAGEAISEAIEESGCLDPSEASTTSGQRRYFTELGKRGWVGLSWPLEYGGQGLGYREQAHFAAEESTKRAPQGYNRVGLGIAGPALMHYGDDAQRARYLPRILSGHEAWCQGFSEPDAGSDLAALRTRATMSESGWVIHGMKTWTTLAAEADQCFLLARTGVERHRGITAFVVAMRQPGVAVRPIHQINGGRDFSEVYFDGVAVTPADVIGSVDGGWQVAMGALEFERSINLVQRQCRLHEMAADLSATVERLDLGGTVRNELLSVSIAERAMRDSVADLLAQLDRGGVPGVEANAGKVFWSETYQSLARLGVDIAAAVDDEALLAGWLEEYYSSLATSIYAGTNEIQRNVIGERGLGLPR